MKLLLTGTTGFIGTHLMRHLSQLKIPCVAIVRPQSNTALHRELQIPTIIDSGNQAELTDHIRYSQCTGIIHLASLYLDSHTPHQVKALIESNIEFPTRVLEAAIQSRNLKWFINTGTFWQHYNNESYNPVNLYAATKQAFQDILKYYVECHEIKSITLKLCDTYGPNDSRKKLIPLLLTNSVIPLELSAGNQILELIFIEDAVSAFVHSAKTLENKSNNLINGANYKVSSDEPLSLKQVVATVEKVLDRTLLVKWGARPYRKREMMSPWIGSAKLPNWKASFSLEEGIKKICH